MKYSNESALGRKRADALKNSASNDERVTERAYPSGQKVDPSVCIGPLQGEPAGCVDINSPAYTGKFGK